MIPVNCVIFFASGIRLAPQAASGSERRGDHRGLLSVQLVPNYFGVSRRFASSCTDFVVVDLLILDLVDRPHGEGGFVICLAKTR